MYQAKITKDGAERFGLPEGTVVEYDLIQPPGKAVLNLFLDGQRIGGTVSFTGDDRTVDLLTWPPGFAESLFPSMLAIGVTQEDLDNGSWRGKGDDGIALALRRDYPEFQPRVSNPNGGVGLVKDGLMGWYPSTEAYVNLIIEIDLTDGQPVPTSLVMHLDRVLPAPED